MNDAQNMPYNPIQGQGQGHNTLKVQNSYIFKLLSRLPFKNRADQ